MAVTITNVKRLKFLNDYSIVAKVTLDTSYPTGGYALTPQQFGLSSFDFVMTQTTIDGYITHFDHTNNKLKLMTPTAAHTHTENTAATYTQNATTGSNAAAAGSEVTNGTNLSTSQVRLLVIGT